MKLFPKRCCKKKCLVIAATTLLGIVSTISITRAKDILAAPPLHSVYEREGRRTPPPTSGDSSKANRPERCPHRVESLDGPGAGKEWHRGGWAVRQLCRQPLDTLFFVLTAPKNWNRRVDLRATLFEKVAGTAFNWTGVFFIGNDHDPMVNLWTKFEAAVMGDVVMMPYNDTLVTLVNKFVDGMQWVTEYCPNVRTIVKIDDDVGVQPFELRRYLDEKLPQETSSIHCYVFSNSAVIRHPHSKYCVPEEELAQDWYPLYCSGRSMIMTMDTMQKLFRASKIIKGYAMDDAYVSGHLALFTNVGHVRINAKVEWFPYEYLRLMIEARVIFTHDYSVYGNSVDRRVQWGLMLWTHVMQAPRSYTFNFSYRLADMWYRHDYRQTRRALQKGLYLP